MRFLKLMIPLIIFAVTSYAQIDPFAPAPSSGSSYDPLYTMPPYVARTPTEAVEGLINAVSEADFIGALPYINHEKFQLTESQVQEGIEEFSAQAGALSYLAALVVSISEPDYTNHGNSAEIRVYISNGDDFLLDLVRINGFWCLDDGTVIE